MAASDYIFCKKCKTKYLYVGLGEHNVQRQSPENEDDWLTCPDCVEKLEAENAELKQERDEFELGADAEAKEVDRLNAKNKRLRDLINRALPYVKDAGFDAEAEHDNYDGDFYMDFGMYEIMQDVARLINDIKDALQ